MLPRRREKELLIEELPNETIVYDTTKHKVHCLNTIARLVWQHCTGRTSEARMVEILRKELNIPADEAAVQLTLEKLAQAGLLQTEEHTWFASPTSRRQAVKGLAKFGIAAAGVLVATIVAPSAAMAAPVSASCNPSQGGGCAPGGPPACNPFCAGSSACCSQATLHPACTGMPPAVSFCCCQGGVACTPGTCCCNGNGFCPQSGPNAGKCP